MSATNPLRSFGKTVLLRVGLYGWVWRLRRCWSTINPANRRRNRRWRRTHPDAPPLPPARLIYDVIGVYDIEAYVEGGAGAARKITTALAEVGRPIDDFASVLDFGCGCGRILRHFSDRPQIRWHGCDYNPELVSWCAANLAFARFAGNELAPPLSYAAGSFDLIYANSVFTHLEEDLQLRWLDELRRVLRRQGVLLLTTHGAAWRNGLDRNEGRAWDRGELVVRAASSSGSNLCEAYHPPRYLRAVAEERFARVHHLPRGTVDQREQDVWVLEL